MTDIKNRLEKLQADNNYPGVARLVKLASYEGIERRDVLKFLAKDIVTQQTKETKKKKPTGHVVAMVPNELWNVDIFDMSKYVKANKGYRYLLACVDVFTRKAYVEPMQNKNTVAAREAFQSIIARAKAQPRSILIDNDAGFLSTDGSTGETFSKYLEGKQIAMSTNALKDHHAMAIIDNFAKRIKSVMNKMILRHNVATWYHKIQKIVDIYNSTDNSAIMDVKPEEVADDGEVQEEIVDLNIQKNKRIRPLPK